MSISRSIKLSVRFSALLALALAALPALAVEGHIPIAAPFVIGASGRYYVANNIVGGGAPVITVVAADVDIDLNGFVLTGAAGFPVIAAAPVSDHLTIHNGTIVGGTIGIDVPGAGSHRKVDIEDVKIHDTTSHAIHMGDVPGAVIRHTEIATCGAAGSGILWDGAVAIKTGTIEDNVIRLCASGISISTCSSVAIINNRVHGSGGGGIGLASCNGSLIAENTVEESRVAEGIFLSRSSKNKLFDNVVTSSCLSGIHLDPTSNNNLVLNNNSSGNLFCFGAAAGTADGIQDEGTQNVIQGNVLNSNARYGLSIFGPGGAPPVAPAVGPPGCSNTYGGNTARGNFGVGAALACVAVPAPGQAPPQLCIPVIVCVVPATPNTSFGNNLMPGPPPG